MVEQRGKQAQHAIQSPIGALSARACADPAAPSVDSGPRPALIVEMGADVAPAHAPVAATTCLSNKNNFEHAKQLKERVEILVRQAAEIVPVPIVHPLPSVLPDSTRGLNALSATTIRKILIQKHLPCDDNKKKNVARLLAYVKKNGTAVDAATAPVDQPTIEDSNPFLNGFSCNVLSRDECCPVQSYVMSLATVAKSAHRGLDDCCEPVT